MKTALVRKIGSNDERIVDGKTYIVKHYYRMNYSGEWEPDGYEITVDGKTYNLIGYPTNQDLKNLV